jgi:hypothetical protein
MRWPDDESCASVGKRLVSIAVTKRLGTLRMVVRKDSTGWASTCGVLSAELAAIAAILTYAQDRPNDRSNQSVNLYYL